MRNVFVGFLFAIGLFMFSYKGYGDIDNLLGTAACIFALLVAFCPYSSENPLIHYIHFISAALFLLILATFSLFLFTIKEDRPTKEKIIRNKIYIRCGIVIIGSLFLISLYMAIPSLKESAVSRIKPIFLFESISLWAFGFSWLTKGGFFYPDPKS